MHHPHAGFLEPGAGFLPNNPPLPPGRRTQAAR